MPLTQPKRAWSRCPFMLGVVVLLFLGTHDTLAQYRFDHWTTDNGLPNNSIWMMLQTRDGYLWLTTSQGLVRFDGVRLTVYDKSNSPGITGNRFSVLHEDRAGNLWAGTEDGGVLRYRDGVFTNWSLKDGLPGIRVERIDEDSSGTIWIFTDGGVATWRDGQLTKVTPTPGANLKDFVWSKEEAYDRFRTGAWQRSAESWKRFSRGTWTTLPFPSQMKTPALLRYLLEDTRGRLWYGLLDSERDQYGVTDGQLQTFTLPDELTQAFYQDRQGRLWASNKADDIFLWKDGQTVRLSSLESPSPSAFGPLKRQGSGLLPQSLAWNRLVFEDREGNAWLGTYDKGLLKLIEQSVSFLSLPGSTRERYVYPLLEDRAGQVWVSAGEAGLIRYANGQFTRFPLAGVTGATELSSLYEDRDGSLWVGTYKHGIAHLRDGGLRTDQTLSARIKGRVDVIHRDRRGDLWFGSQTGLYRLDSAGQMTHYTPAQGLACTHVKTLLEDASGRLWIGGYGGVTLWQNGAVQKTWKQTDGLLSDRVITLYEDRERMVWVGTYDGGLFRLREEEAGWKLTRYTTREGLFSNEVKQILEDEQGFFWIGSSRGIYRLRKQELNDFADGRISAVTVTHFGKADGLANLDISSGFQPSGFRARDGRLWFPTQDGIAVIDPRRIPFNPTPPPVVIEDCLLDRQNAPCRQGLTIKPGQTALEISYTALSFHKSEQLRFRYRMDGLEESWNEVGTRRTAYYSHLPSGNYTFHVIAANSDGVWNTEGQRLRITVLPPFYRTWWFLSLSSIALIGTTAWIFRSRVTRLKQRQRQQETFARQLIESQETERQRIAAELHDSLSQSLVIIKNRALMALQAPVNVERATAQLEEIAESSVSAIDEVREIAYALRPFHLDRLGLTKAITEMVEKMAAAHALQATINLTPLDGLWPPDVEINLYRIVQESLNNIAKHAQATTCRITAHRTGRTVEMEIADNGRGFEQAERGRPNAEARTTSHSGFGLLGMAERVRLLGGQWQIHSAPGAGTTITIKLSVTDKSTPSPGNQTDES